MRTVREHGRCPKCDETIFSVVIRKRPVANQQLHQTSIYRCPRCGHRWSVDGPPQFTERPDPRDLN